MFNNSKAQDTTDYYRPILWGLICGVIATVFMLFVLAFVLTLRDLPTGAVMLFSSLSAGFGGLIGGFFAARKAGRKGLVFGALTGVFLYIIILLASLVVSSGGFTVQSLIKLLITVISASIGGIMGVNMKNKRKYV